MPATRTPCGITITSSPDVEDGTWRYSKGGRIERKYFDIACRRIDDAARRPNLFVAKDPAPAPATQEALL